VVQDVEFIADELILLSHGEILRKGSAQQLLAELEEKVWEVIVAEDDLQKVQEHGTIAGIAKEQEGICIRLISHEKPSVFCHQVKPNLEDVYLFHFGVQEGL